MTTEKPSNPNEPANEATDELLESASGGTTFKTVMQDIGSFALKTFHNPDLYRTPEEIDKHNEDIKTICEHTGQSEFGFAFGPHSATDTAEKKSKQEWDEGGYDQKT